MQKSLTGWFFASPWLLGLCLLFVYPFVASLYWSFCQFDLLSPPKFVGTMHYQRLAHELLHGERFGQAIWNTCYFACLSVPLTIVMGIALASLLSQQKTNRTGKPHTRCRSAERLPIAQPKRLAAPPCLTAARPCLTLRRWRRVPSANRHHGNPGVRADGGSAR